MKKKYLHQMNYTFMTYYLFNCRAYVRYVGNIWYVQMLLMQGSLHAFDPSQSLQI